MKRPEGTVWQKAVNILEAVSYVAIIFGVAVAVYEYQGQVDRWKKDRSFEFVSRFQSERFASAREAILRPWLGYDLKRLSASDVSRTVLEELVHKVVASNSSDDANEDIRNHLILITEFLDTVYNCARARVCDESVVNAQLGDFSTAFYCLYEPALVRIRAHSRLAQLGEPLGEFVIRRGGCPTPSDQATSHR